MGRVVSILDRVIIIVSEQLGVEESEVKLNSSFVDDLGADSLDVVELVMAFEKDFDIEIPDEDAENISTVGEVVDYIFENMGIRFGGTSGKIKG